MPAQPEIGDTTQDMARLLAAACMRHFGHAVRTEGLFRHSGGASRQTWGFDAIVAHPDGEQRHALVLRRDPPAAASTMPAGESSLALDRGLEFELLRVAYRHGVPVPAPLFALTAADGLGDGFVMRHVPGTAIARELLREPRYTDARSRIVPQLGAILARLHAVPLDELPRLRRVTPAEAIAQQRQVLDRIGEPHPVFELALTWLARRLPAAEVAPCFVHGDFRTGNFLADESGVTAILDWEIAHTGDPLEDLGWMCIKSWRFGAVENPAGGFGQREALHAAYEAAGGPPVDKARAYWWEIFGTARWGIICMAQAWKHLSGAEHSVELASIGRRCAETEVDLLQLLSEA
ncbi:phosphotransferase family protein [Vineibacter terrae]|uniref:Phosphotransferase family protein n=1 Tax=Vineibacter terrae TaxID=2586908 RepID=A0A5C8P853_9HYPH|nr:phosphotransferase family protein [Vineibacter terrae]TXL69571.1 phosphotransferase family protein [Vineibacter terrae]